MALPKAGLSRNRSWILPCLKSPRSRIRITTSAYPPEIPSGKFMESFECRSVPDFHPTCSLSRKRCGWRYFTGLTIAHPLLVKAYEHLRRAISEVSSDSLIFVFGPSGVGKTTMTLRFEQRLIEEMSLELAA